MKKTNLIMLQLCYICRHTIWEGGASHQSGRGVLHINLLGGYFTSIRERGISHQSGRGVFHINQGEGVLHINQEWGGGGGGGDYQTPAHTVAWYFKPKGVAL